jgi:peptidoglycan glycosyltransferase
VVAGKSQRAIPRNVAAEIGKMMVRTTRTGTAARTFSGRRPGTPLHGMEIAGKTGSLSVVKPSYLGISWFVAYAPADKPEVIVSVVLGNPESWWLKAHTAARILLEKALAPQPMAKAGSSGTPAK